MAEMCNDPKAETISTAILQKFSDDGLLLDDLSVAERQPKDDSRANSKNADRPENHSREG